MVIDKPGEIHSYPDFTDLDIRMRHVLHPVFAKLQDVVSEFTFACIYLFRNTYRYRISRLAIGGLKDLYQFINISFASILPDKYAFISRKQDLGDEALRKAKMSYKPVGFIRKYRVYKK